MEVAFTEHILTYIKLKMLDIYRFEHIHNIWRAQTFKMCYSTGAKYINLITGLQCSTTNLPEVRPDNFQYT